MLNFSLTSDLTGILPRMTGAFKVGQKIIDQQVVKDGNFYVPKDTGNLEGSGIRATVMGSGRVAWETPYARRLYYNPQYNFSTDSNPNAQGLWFEAAKSRHREEWIRMGEEAIRRRL